MTNPEILAMIAQRQADVVSLQATLDARISAISNPPVLQATARRAHSDQTPKDSAHADAWATWNAEEAAHGSDGTLWTQPEHAYWLRLASDALKAGVIDPVTA